MSDANETKLDSADLGEMHIVATRAMHAGFKLVAIDPARLCEVLDVALLVARSLERVDPKVPLDEQFFELFETRSKELGQARAALHAARERLTVCNKSLSHVLHENERLEKRIEELSKVERAARELRVDVRMATGVTSDEAAKQAYRDVLARLDELFGVDDAEPSAGDYVAGAAQ